MNTARKQSWFLLVTGIIVALASLAGLIAVGTYQYQQDRLHHRQSAALVAR